VKIYTRHGDRGETDLFGGPRVPKDHLRVEVYGALDELNACLGVCSASSGQADLRDAVQRIQRVLFELGSYLATPDSARREKSGLGAPGDDDVAALEAWIDGLSAELEPLRRFVLPGGCSAAAAFHVARTVCRRVERRAVGLDRCEPLEGSALRFLNRLSDLLFVMARVENHRAGLPDVPWEGPGR
jgi:cob(I)alamin adenosyltransferase